MHEEALLPERQYIMKIGSKSVLAAVTELKHEINITKLPCCLVDGSVQVEFLRQTGSA